MTRPRRTADGTDAGRTAATRLILHRKNPQSSRDSLGGAGKLQIARVEVENAVRRVHFARRQRVSENGLPHRVFGQRHRHDLHGSPFVHRPVLRSEWNYIVAGSCLSSDRQHATRQTAGHSQIESYQSRHLVTSNKKGPLEYLTPLLKESNTPWSHYLEHLGFSDCPDYKGSGPI